MARRVVDKYRIAEIILIVFSAVESITAVAANAELGGTIPTAPGGPLGFFWVNSVPLGLAGWSAVGLVTAGAHFGRKSRARSLFAARGFEGQVYDLMIGMRGGGSRLALLRSMQEPRHRQELAVLTGIDWKEVDREVTVLEKYGLVKVYAQSGSVRMYQVTEQGRLLMKMVDDLQSARTRW